MKINRICDKINQLQRNVKQQPKFCAGAGSLLSWIHAHFWVILIVQLNLYFRKAQSSVLVKKTPIIPIDLPKNNSFNYNRFFFFDCENSLDL